MLLRLCSSRIIEHKPSLFFSFAFKSDLFALLLLVQKDKMWWSLFIHLFFFLQKHTECLAISSKIYLIIRLLKAAVWDKPSEFTQS